MADKTIKGSVKIQAIRFQKNGFGILIVSPILMEEGVYSPPSVDKYGEFCIKGNIPNVEVGQKYSVMAKECVDPTWGIQYNLVFMNQSINVSTQNEQKIFLGRILTPTQLTTLYETLENPFEVIKNEDVESLTKVKGVGLTTACKLIEKYKETIDYSSAYIKLEAVGLSDSMIKKLCDAYGSPDILVQKFEEDPYILCKDVSGIGFKKADEFALKFGIGKTSPKRVRAFIRYFLEEEAQKGNSWVVSKTLIDAINIALGEVGKDILGSTIKGMDDLWWAEDKRRIGLKKYFNLETNIAKELMRLHNAENTFIYDGWEDKIMQIQKNIGFEYTEDQKNGVELALKNNVVCITGLAGCVDADTEFFNGEGWKKISEYREGDKVLQYHANGEADLVKPLNYIKERCDELTLVKNESGSINQCLCDEHNFVYLTNTCRNLKSEKFSNIKKMHLNSKRGFNGRIITNFKYGASGIDLSNDEIRLMIAVIADGNFGRNTLNCRIRIKKDRKIQRLRMLLKKANIEWKETMDSEEGFFRFWFNAPRNQKIFTKDWYNCSKEQLNIIIDEIFHWDGSITNNYSEFFTSEKESADFIQFAFSSCGYRSSIYTNDRIGEVFKNIDEKEYVRKSLEYIVHLNKSETVSLTTNPKHVKDMMTQYKTKDGYKYCFTVPSSMLVLRRSDRIFITGNCGKTTITKAVLEILKTYQLSLCCLSGKAAQRMTEVTGYESHTIHRLLGFKPPSGFEFNEKNQMDYDVVILDEASMLGGELFLDLIKAIKTGSKLIILGDAGQLSSIGACNVFHDLLTNGIIPCVKLTKIHRQAQKSAVITESIKMRKGEQIFKKDYSGKQILGELQDLELDIFEDNSQTAKKLIMHFKEKLPTVNNILDIQLLVAQKTRGDTCTFRVNNAIQKMYNPDGENEVEISLSKDLKYKLREGDKVINVQNNYKSLTIQGSVKAVFNGNIGIIEKINADMGLMVINFEEIGRLVIEKSKWNNIQLGYVITTHKSQGSSWKCVIVGIDYSSYMSLSCEWLYTAITRTEKYCVLCGENKAIRFAISQSKTPIKQTFLSDILKQVKV